jgi:Holliday junction resolvase RusA-like endonuclease
MKEFYKYTLYLTPVTQKNNRMVTKKKTKSGKTRPLLIKSPQSQKYTKAAIKSLEEQKEKNGPHIPIKQKCLMEITHYFKGKTLLDWDGASSGVSDALEKAGVVENDRLFKKVIVNVIEESGMDDKTVIKIYPKDPFSVKVVKETKKSVSFDELFRKI